jgi:DNA-binding transcriptional regulator YiaG
MIKSIVSFALFAVLGISVVALPAFAPKAKAADTAALAKSDRLQVRSVAQRCSRQVWPDFDATCLRNTDGSDAKIVVAYLTTARRWTACSQPEQLAAKMKKKKSQSETDVYIGSQLRQARLSQAITQQQLAEALGVSFQQVQNYENGANGLSAVRLFAICKFLNVSLPSMFPAASD